MAQVYETVPAGRYLGWTLAQLQAELAKYQAQIRTLTLGPGRVVGASVNGKSFSYEHGSSIRELDAAIAEIQDAMSWVDDTVIALPSETAVRFR